MIHEARPEDWQRVRAIRLAALEDAPEAFGTTLPEDLARPDNEWTARLKHPIARTYLAVENDQDVGLVTGFPYEPIERTGGLFSMWVAPSHRRHGHGVALVEAVIDWARQCGFTQVVLDVANSNEPAVRLYERMGFVANGVTGTLPPPREHILEHQRVFKIRDA